MYVKSGSSWSLHSQIYYYQYNQCLSTLTLWVRILLSRGVLDTMLCDKAKFVSDLRQVSGFLRVLLFPPPIKIDSHDITEIMLKEALNTITLYPLYVRSTRNIPHFSLLRHQRWHPWTLCSDWLKLYESTGPTNLLDCNV